MDVKKDILWRVGVVYVAIFLFAIIIIVKILYLQFAEKEKWTSKAEILTLKNEDIEPNRGDIYDMHYRLLATSVPYYEIRMDPNSEALTDEVFYKNIGSLAHFLADLFQDKSRKEYRRELILEKKEGERYHLIQRNVDFYTLQKVKQFPIFKLGQYKGGFIYKQTNERKLLFENLASRIIGYSKSELGIFVGNEGAYDSQLKGKTGFRLVQKLSGGVWMPVNNSYEVEPIDGKDIITTIDINIQDIAHEALNKQLKLQNALQGTVVLMEVQTGEIRAIVNLKRKNNNSEFYYKEEYNQAIGTPIEPGSTFKLASLIVALEDGYIDITDSIDAENGEKKWFTKTMYDSKPLGKITVQKVFEESSNIGVSKIIYRYYNDNPQKFIDRLYSMNLNEKLDIEIDGEGKPIIRYPDDPLWSNLSLPWMATGYGIELTPLQILTFYNAVANNGKMVKPKFVKAILFHGDTIRTYKTQIINNSICSEETIKKAKIMLEGVVENGTAKNIKNNNYKIAGKTGTSVTNYWKDKDKDEDKKYQASFVGYFPADNPKYSCIVVITEPSKHDYYASLIAAPVFKEIADKIYAKNFNTQPARHCVLAGGKKIHSQQNTSVPKIPYPKNGYKQHLDFVFNTLGTPTKPFSEIYSDWVITTRQNSYVEYKNQIITNNIVPQVIGMGARDVLFLLENAGLKVIIRGKGNVTKQSISPGTPIKKGDKIVIQLS